mgnify:FL=1
MKNLFVIKNCAESMLRKLSKNEKGEGFTELIILACIGVIIAAFVILPGLKDFAQKVMLAFSNWWDNTISGKIFPTS